MNNQKGFTLIELVVVIVVLGILAAFALPRFINVTSEARAATVEACAGSLRAAVALARAQYMAEGDATATDGRYGWDQCNVHCRRAGFPWPRQPASVLPCKAPTAMILLTARVPRPLSRRATPAERVKPFMMERQA